ncbi:hypothetical protein Scep_012687 [Stephania cephalantha]|uniref:lipid-A-disaccharide synthase n=1 Tax=Stephania cephalantha TaxID=152367 RepID=A0AAP0JFV3_9MAGN
MVEFKVLREAELGFRETKMMIGRTRNAFSVLVSRGWWCSMHSTSSVVEMAAKEGELRVFMVAGEVSGDAIASRLMSSLKKLSPLPPRFSGVGGSLMSKEGLQSLFPMEDIAVMGIWELLPHLYKIRTKLKMAIEAALLFQPHVVVTVDAKGFSFHFLRQLRARCKQRGLASALHFHYVAPSFWAWKGGEARLKGLKEFVDHLFCILPFEEEVCRRNGLAATFVGHPIVEDALDLNSALEGNSGIPSEQMVQGDDEGVRKKYEPSSGGKPLASQDTCFRYSYVPYFCAFSMLIMAEGALITLLPGSRLQEVSRMLPIFSKTVELLKDVVPDLMTVIPVAPNKHVENYVCRATQTWPVSNSLVLGASSHLKYNTFKASRAALCTSGTAALELQLARLPCVIAYRAHFLTELFIRYKAKIPYISLPNILLNSAVIPEVLFNACTPKNLAKSLLEVIRMQDIREKQMDAAAKVLQLLSPSERTAGLFGSQESRFRNYTPCMIAASTILHYIKQNQ